MPQALGDIKKQAEDALDQEKSKLLAVIRQVESLAKQIDSLCPRGEELVSNITKLESIVATLQQDNGLLRIHQEEVEKASDIPHSESAEPDKSIQRTRTIDSQALTSHKSGQQLYDQNRGNSEEDQQIHFTSGDLDDTNASATNASKVRPFLREVQSYTKSAPVRPQSHLTNKLENGAAMPRSRVRETTAKLNWMDPQTVGKSYSSQKAKGKRAYEGADTGPGLRRPAGVESTRIRRTSEQEDDFLLPLLNTSTFAPRFKSENADSDDSDEVIFVARAKVDSALDRFRRGLGRENVRKRPRPDDDGDFSADDGLDRNADAKRRTTSGRRNEPKPSRRVPVVSWMDDEFPEPRTTSGRKNGAEASRRLSIVSSTDDDESPKRQMTSRRKNKPDASGRIEIISLLEDDESLRSSPPILYDTEVDNDPTC